MFILSYFMFSGESMSYGEEKFDNFEIVDKTFNSIDEAKKFISLNILEVSEHLDQNEEYVTESENIDEVICEYIQKMECHSDDCVINEDDNFYKLYFNTERIIFSCYIRKFN